MENEVMDLIEELYTMVSEAWGVPLGNDKCIVERDKVLNMLEDIKAQLPVELSEAKSIRRAAEEKARSMVEEQEIVRIARARSSELMATAENRTAELRRVAGEYVEDLLRRTEESLTAALGEVRNSHNQFRSATGAAEGQPAQRNNSQ